MKLKRVTPLLITIASSYLLICLLVWLAQRKLLYFGGGPPGQTPEIPFEDVEIESSDGARLHGWWLPAQQPWGAVLYFHGNAGNIEFRLPIARTLVGMGLDVLLFDYRGYGRSSGSPSEAGTYLDGEAMHAWLIARMGERGLGPGQLALWGESLGGGVAIELAGRRACGALVTESAFTSVADMARRSFFWLPVELLVRDRYQSIDKVGQLSIPMLVIHSPDDELIPYDHCERLVAAARDARHLRTDGGHNDGGFLRAPSYREAVRVFLERALEP